MNKATPAVAELLALIHPAAMRQADIHTNLQALLDDPPSRSTVYRAVDDLLENGYVQELPNSEDHYRITDVGLEWLDGEIQNLEFVSDGD